MRIGDAVETVQEIVCFIDFYSRKVFFDFRLPSKTIKKMLNGVGNSRNIRFCLIWIISACMSPVRSIDAQRPKCGVIGVNSAAAVIGNVVWPLQRLRSTVATVVAGYALMAE